MKLLATSRRTLLARALDASGCGYVLRRKQPAWRGILVLNYHRIGDSSHSLMDRNLWSATSEDFDAQVSILAKDFDIVGLHDFEDALKCSKGRYAMVTFDDGYRDNYTDAFPILKRHNVPATFFLTTGFLDSSKMPWWDEIAWMVRTSSKSSLPANRWMKTPLVFDEPHRADAIVRLLRIFKSMDGEITEEYVDYLAQTLETGRCPSSVSNELWMTWDMVREMRDKGLTFGGHTVTHPILANLSSEQQDWEIGECTRRLTEELRECPLAFSYPVGGPSSFNLFTRHSLQKHGYRWGFSYYGQHCRPGYDDMYSIPRTGIETDVNLTEFRAIMTLPQWFA